MKYLLIFIICAVVLVVGSAMFSGAVSKNKLLTTVEQSRYESSQLWQGEITPSHDNFNILILYGQNPDLSDQNEYRLTIESEGKVLSESIFSGINVGGRSDLRVQFSPVCCVTNKKLEINISPVTKLGNLQFAVNAEGSLAYAAYYRESSWVASSKSTIAKVVKKVVADKGFLLVWIISISAVTAWTLKKHD